MLIRACNPVNVFVFLVFFGFFWAVFAGGSGASGPSYPDAGYNFTQLGVRIPTVLISPWIERYVPILVPPPQLRREPRLKNKLKDESTDTSPGLWGSINVVMFFGFFLGGGSSPFRHGGPPAGSTVLARCPQFRPVCSTSIHI